MGLEQRIDPRLLLVDLSDLRIAVDSWMHFTQGFEHAGGSEPRSKDLLCYLYASVLAQRCTTWYIREEMSVAPTPRRDLCIDRRMLLRSSTHDLTYALSVLSRPICPYVVIVRPGTQTGS